MDALRMLLVVFVATVSFVSGQYIPADYPWDCRRPLSSCKGEVSSCKQDTGLCECSDPDIAYDCGLPVADKEICSAADTCQNNADCTTDSAKPCYCTSNTYGDKCQNGRVNVHCSKDGMFINIYPHGDDDFSGNIFLNTLSTTSGRDTPACQLIKITDPPVQELQDAITEYGVTDVQGEPPTLLGYYIALPHVAGTGDCESAEVTEDDSGQTDYIRRVVVEYNPMIISSLDQVHIFNCSVSSTSSPTFPSVNSMSVTILNDDYQHVNATDTIEPITFEIRNPDTKAIITSSIRLGDPLDLVFFLSSPAPADDTTSTTLYSSFYVDSCIATNGQLQGSKDYKFVQFLEAGCPTANSTALYRDSIIKEAEGDGKDKALHLNAFRFVGVYDQVAFTCQVKLCTPADVAENAEACAQPVCSAEEGSGEDGTTTPNPDNDNTEDTTADPADDTTADPADPADDTTADPADPADDTTADPADDTTETESTDSRRKRDAAGSTDEVSNSIKVTSSYDGGNSDATGSTYNESNCMLHSDVIRIVVIFSVILCLLVIVVVIVVARLLRSRTKVVEAHDMSTVTRSQCSLPRLSINTNRNNI